MSDDKVPQITVGDLIVALTEEAESSVKIEPKELHILVAYILSDLFGSASVSRSWH